MNSQMLVGGKKIEDTPAFRNALEEKQRMIREEYENKLNEIEREKNMVFENKNQVERL
jgi:kinesin family protein 3/17